MVNISSQAFSPAVVVSFLIIQVTPLIQANEDDQLYFTGIATVIFGCVNYMLTYVGLGMQFSAGFKLPGDFPSFARPDGVSIYIETAIAVVISFVLLLQVNSSYIWLAVFPVITIGFILALSNELNHQLAQNGSQQRDEGEASSSSAGSGSYPGAGIMETKKSEGEGQEIALLVLYWVLCIMGQSHSAANNFAVSLFLLFLSFTLGALTRMMTKLAQTNAAPGGAPASALLRKASLAVLLVAVHAVAVELLGEQVVLFILPELAPLLLWLSVHVDRAKEGAIIAADQITLNRNLLVNAVAVVVLAMACLAPVAMDESTFFWVAKAVVSCGVSGLLVWYLAFMISQWQGQDAEATPFLEEMVKMLKVWAKVLLVTAVVLLVSTSVVAVRLGLHVQMLAAPAEFFNKYVTSS